MSNLKKSKKVKKTNGINKTKHTMRRIKKGGHRPRNKSRKFNNLQNNNKKTLKKVGLTLVGLGIILGVGAYNKNKLKKKLKDIGEVLGLTEEEIFNIEKENNNNGAPTLNQVLPKKITKSQKLLVLNSTENTITFKKLLEKAKELRKKTNINDRTNDYNTFLNLYDENIHKNKNNNADLLRQLRQKLVINTHLTNRNIGEAKNLYEQIFEQKK